MPFVLPAAFSAALARDHVSLDTWVEIEGLPWAFGLLDRAASWFSARPAAQQRLGVAGLLVDLPRGAEQEARPLDAESSVGQMTVQLQLDDAGIVLPLIGNGARKDSLLRLSADMDSTSAVGTIAFSGDASAWPSSGVAYLGREAFTYTGKTAGTLTGCARGAFALPGLEARQAHTAGDLLSYYPRFLATRRLFVFCSLTGVDAERVTRWAGTVRGARLSSGGAGVEISAESLDGDLAVKLFSNQRTGKLAKGLAGPGGLTDYQKQSDTELDPEASRIVLAADSSSGTWTAGAQLLIRLGDEYITGTVAVNGAETSITVAARGVFSSQAVQHVPGDELKEVIWTGARNVSGSPADQVSQFTQGDHPFVVALCFLCSRKGDGANGAYDVLPEGWGLGIDASRIDLAGIASVRRMWFSGARHLWVYEEPFRFKDALQEMLRPHACYPVTTLGDLLTLRRLSPPVPGATLRTVDATAIVSVPTWDANIADVVGRVRWNCDHDPIGGDPRQKYIGELQGPGTEAQEFYAGLWKTLEVEAKGQFTGNDAMSAYFGSGLSTGAPEAALRYFEMVRDRYARPFPVIGVECSLDCLDVEVGDLVSLSVANLPDVTTGGLGIAGAVCEVLRKSVDDLRGVVALTLLHSTAGTQYRLMSPSGIVSATTTGLITLTDGEFNDADQLRTVGFYAGQVIQVWDKLLKTSRGTATLTSVSATQLGMATVPAGTIATDVVVLAAYASQPTVEKLRHVSLASTAELLGTSDAAHTYAT
jgi:hypothetical protein